MPIWCIRSRYFHRMINQAIGLGTVAPWTGRVIYRHGLAESNHRGAGAGAHPLRLGKVRAEGAHRVAVLPSVGGKLFARQLPAGPPSIEGMLEHVPAAAGLLELCPEIHGSGSLRSGDG